MSHRTKPECEHCSVTSEALIALADEMEKLVTVVQKLNDRQTRNARNILAVSAMLPGLIYPDRDIPPGELN